MALLYDAQQFTIYAGFFFLIAGTIGNATNIFVFSEVLAYRRTSCTFYFLIESITNLLYVLFNISARILSVAYGIDLTSISRTGCKLRHYFLVTPTIVSMSCSCLAAIDQFLVTSKSNYLRNLISVRRAHRTVLVVVVLSCLHGIPILIYYDIRSNICAIVDPIYYGYTIFYLLGLVCAIPCSILSIFGWLTYCNIKKTKALTRSRTDHQLVRMTLYQIILVVVSLIPYGVYMVYNMITSATAKDFNRQLKEYFSSTVISMVTYFYFAGSCYVFLMSSSRFRRNVRDRIFCSRQTNRINPVRFNVNTILQSTRK
ncbi:unnamed protein product [Adineta ricciae]|uniref:G-protein coupled receptors family 1 profile domain-containing protein n=1 Tax=Adineta ricciae TaxID=249248 RepID=A0A815LWD9_ADIRI|nr:unnamed protein product [Adineta ricciae]